MGWMWKSCDHGNAEDTGGPDGSMKFLDCGKWNTDDRDDDE